MFNWVVFGQIGLIVFAPWVIPESARWLMVKGETTKCLDRRTSQAHTPVNGPNLTGPDTEGRLHLLLLPHPESETRLVVYVLPLALQQIPPHETLSMNPR